MARRRTPKCDCGKKRSGATQKKDAVRVSKPTAWGYVHTQNVYTYTCNDCGLKIEDMKIDLAMKVFSPPPPDTTDDK